MPDSANSVLPDDWDEIRFWVTLIKVTRRPESPAQSALERNCTHVKGPYWIMEGDTDYLRDEGLKFREIAEGAVGCLGDFTTPQMVEVCQRSFGVHIP